MHNTPYVVENVTFFFFLLNLFCLDFVDFISFIISFFNGQKVVLAGLVATKSQIFAFFI